MKHALALFAGLSACGIDNNVTVQSPTYEEELCVDQLSGEVVSYENFDPSSFPLNVPSIDEVGMFTEIFDGFRNDIYAVISVRNVDKSYSFYDTEIASAIEDINFAGTNIEYENGDFQVKANLGEVPALSNVEADVLITDGDCKTLYGLAGYFFTPNENSYDASLQYYLDENGDLVYL